MTDTSDISSLVTRAQQGDVRAFETLIADHIPQVRRFARGFARSDADAADMAQEALVKTYLCIKSYRFQAAFATWLFRIVRNTCIDAIRKRKREEKYTEPSIDVADIENRSIDCLEDEKLVRQEELQLLWRALNQVPTEFRTVMILFDIEGFSMNEVAAIERIALGTVKSRLSRGRKHLKRLLRICENESSQSTSGNLAQPELVKPDVKR